MSSTQHQLIEQCATRLRGIVEALDNIHDTSPHRWSTDLDDVHSSAESLLAMIKDQAPPSEDQLIAAGLSYPLAKEDAVQLWYAGFRSEVVTVLEAWEAIGHDIGMNPSKGELLDSLRNMAAICNAHGNDMPAQSAIDQRQAIADAITGALAFGAQASRPPPADHWLRPFYDIGRAEGQRTQELAMLVRMLASSLKRHAPESNLVARATNYLAAKGLAGTPLRDAPASVEQVGGDERAAFELFVRKHCGMPAHIAVNWDAKFTNDAWAGWQARAALAQPSGEVVVTKNESGAIVSVTRQDKEGRVLSVIAESATLTAQAEKAEVVARVVHSNPVVLGQCGPLNANDELMTVAQHAASVARWAEMFNRVEQQRDAALAEVERLRQFERICEGLPQDAIDGGWTVQGIRGYAKRLEDQLKAAQAEVEALRAELQSQRERNTELIFKLGSATNGWGRCEKERDAALARVAEFEAQAQHSVPEGWKLVPSDKGCVTSSMKAECIGEFSFYIRAACAECLDVGTDSDCHVCGGDIEYDQKIDVPWDTCKEIYKTMLAAAPGKAQHSVPEVSGIGRDFAYPRSVVLYLRTEPTDDDLRAIHDGLRSLAAAPGKEGV
ncbi:hypothetical protein L4P27_005277 [Pseudomonas aeruginosa]|nr:hypothetical protein [Pseudomonas aeruginosa]EKV3011484.1 hypothetical protein [Pseudomonas aeruginosa]HEJ3884691.1 hypothetical protein [Pseudomonas aeruginosa]HEJ5808476.1 hypothetical protein [Pseudomonas aeruginosa]